ncbi:hypothetical protein AK830_g5988 [Neonectria ditissima]|uniref:Uncharacterized protein n=1 Tax=Neonectria ditissima TaxID=78410 RepID=A0A0P7B3G3_9HYPO|nr:hypothetical protein AK830_g5988 [Neonectria ditissima]
MAPRSRNPPPRRPSRSKHNSNPNPKLKQKPSSSYLVPALSSLRTLPPISHASATSPASLPASTISQQAPSAKHASWNMSVDFNNRDSPVEISDTCEVWHSVPGAHPLRLNPPFTTVDKGLTPVSRDEPFHPQQRAQHIQVLDHYWGGRG